MDAQKTSCNCVSLWPQRSKVARFIQWHLALYGHPCCWMISIWRSWSWGYYGIFIWISYSWDSSAVDIHVDRDVIDSFYFNFIGFFHIFIMATAASDWWIFPKSWVPWVPRHRSCILCCVRQLAEGGVFLSPQQAWRLSGGGLPVKTIPGKSPNKSKRKTHTYVYVFVAICICIL